MENAPVTEQRSAVPVWAGDKDNMRPPGALGGMSGPKITPAQRIYLLDLIEKKELRGGPGGKLDLVMKCLRISEDPEEYGMGKAKASELIEFFLKLPDRAPDETLGAVAQALDIPDGYYALRNLANHKNETTFYRLRTGKHGRWKGYQFIDLVVGGGSRFPQKGQDVRLQIYTAIREQGINESRQLYGQEIGRCGVCGRELTDDTSRAYGIGPVCRDAL